MPRPRSNLLGVPLALALGWAAWSARGAEFHLETADLAQVNAAFASGALTAEKLTALCLARIKAYDQAGPRLRALITVHPRALELARALDAERRQSGPRSALHGIPVILKDNYQTADLPTTAGSRALADFQPAADASSVARLRAAGAVILGKANLGELARNSVTLSSLGGQTLNPYDLTRTPGGSSGGSGVAVAAGFALVAMGTDTGQSIRSPASATATVGFRGTFGLIGRSGVIPNTYTQDAIGPHTRTVADAALVVDLLAGLDTGDLSTWNGLGRQPRTYTAALDPQGLRGARIGFLSQLKGDGSHPEHAVVSAVTDRALDALRAGGAEVMDVHVPGLADLLRDRQPLSISVHESAWVMDQYFAAQQPQCRFRDLAAYLAGAGDTLPAVQKGFRDSLALRTAEGRNEHRRRLEAQVAFRDALVALMDQHRLDALFYPHQRRLVVPVDTEQVERNGFLSSSTGLPAITVPGGFSPATATAPLGVPVGVEFLGRAFAEPTLFRLAHAFEVTTRHRRPPASTPALPGESFPY